MTDPRLAARVLLVDAASRVLLMKWMHAAEPERGAWWITPGGGLDEGESYPEGAVRELFEETGLRVEAAVLGEPVLEREITTDMGTGTFRQREQFFLLRVDQHDVDTAGWTPLEVASLIEHRWWTQAELEATDERLSPRELPSLLRSLGC